MASNRKAVSTGSRSETSSLFKGLVFDDAGNRMSPVHANKAGCRYRYYVSQALLHQRKSHGKAIRNVREILLGSGQPVDAGGQDRLHRDRDPDLVKRLGELDGSVAHQNVLLQERLDHFHRLGSRGINRKIG